MAFQSHAPFFAFLRSVAGRAGLAENAPAENFILDERVGANRETAFLSQTGFDNSPPSSLGDWFEAHKNYTVANVARASQSVTFTDENRPAWLNLEPDWDVVRVETLVGLCDRATGSGVTPDFARELISEWLDQKKGGAAMAANRLAALEKWLGKVNGGRDRRPAFVAAFAEVEDILTRPDWATRLRDALGLGHIGGTTAQPTTIVLIQYNLERVHRTHLTQPAWAAAPTVLDDVATAGPNPCFFPAPTRTSDGYGFTVDLSPVAPSWKREFLHARIDYRLDDIRRIGQIDSDVSVSRIDKARADHRDLLKVDLRHFADMPNRT